MFELYANKTQLTVRQREPVTSGSVNAYKARFDFYPDWSGLTRTAVFKSGGEPVSVLLDETGQCVIPWEVLTSHGRQLTAGVCGMRDGEVVLPTIWANCGVILEGASVGEPARPPTPDLWRQILDALERKADGLDYDGQFLSLLSGDEALASVPIASGGGEGAVYRFGHGLKQEGDLVSVNAVSDFSGDNTLPITASAVQSVVGNIEILLGTI